MKHLLYILHSPYRFCKESRETNWDQIWLLGTLSSKLWDGLSMGGTPTFTRMTLQLIDFSTLLQRLQRPPTDSTKPGISTVDWCRFWHFFLLNTQHAKGKIWAVHWWLSDLVAWSKQSQWKSGICCPPLHWQDNKSQTLICEFSIPGWYPGIPQSRNITSLALCSFLPGPKCTSTTI